MVVGAFPVVKLGVLLFKQISKPIANIAKEKAKNSRFFRTYVCMPPAQFYNWCEIKSKMWILNLGKPVNVPTLNEQMAIELGANLLGEGIIFIIGATVLILEYNRGAKKEAAKEEERISDMNKLVGTVNELYFSVQTQETQIRQMQRVIDDLETRVVVKPWVPKKETDPQEPPPPGSPALPLKEPLKSSGEHSEKSQAQNENLPYPGKSLLMKSLNYVELDILNMPQVEKKQQKFNLIYDRNPSFLTGALYYLEDDIQGLL